MCIYSDISLIHNYRERNWLVREQHIWFAGEAADADKSRYSKVIAGF